MRLVLLILCICVVTIFGLKKEIVEVRRKTSLSCNGKDERLYISSAEWTYDMSWSGWMNYWRFWVPEYRNLAFSFGKLFKMCTYEVTDKIKSRCHGENNCNIFATKHLFKHNSCTYDMILKIDYKCVPCKPNNNNKRRRLRLKRLKRSFSFSPAKFYCDLTVRLPKPKNPSSSKKCSSSCPNTSFNMKHVCTRHSGDNVNSAAMFAIQVQNLRFYGQTSPTNINTVFIAQAPVCYQRSGNYCSFTVRQSKYDCVKRNNWSCVYRGQVIATHDINTGHYFPNMDH